MSLINVLKSHVDSSCILLYGCVTDCILSRDLCCREFSVALHDVLKEAGYDNIVFYDFINASGKYVFDDESAYYSIANAKAPYEARYGGAPKKNAAQKPAVASRPVKAPSGGRRFGAARTVVGTVPEKQPTSTQTAAPEEIPHQQRNLTPAVFYGELRRFMADSSIKTAFVFDINEFLTDHSVRQNVHNLLYIWRNPNNIIIFLHPDGGTDEGDKTLIQRLQQTELYQYFCDVDKRGGVSYRSDRCFPVYDFSKDEIMFLLQRERIFHQIQFTESIKKTADKISYLLHQKEESRQVSLRRFIEKTETYFQSHDKIVNNQFYETVCEIKIDDFDFHPLQSLYQRAGWQKAAQQLVETLAGCIESFRGIKCPYQNMDDKMQWMMEQADSSEEETHSLLVSRLGGTEKRQYPAAAALPHMMLIGKPGTGKTTGANMMGKILHDAGLLATGHVVHASSADLLGEHIGETPSKIRRLLDRCEDGVLFIDEAYTLCKDLDSDGNAGTFAQEAVDTLVNAMTDENRHVVIIFAGYPSSDPSNERGKDGVRALYRMNSGLNRRIMMELEIEDYSPDVLTSIFMQKLSKQNYSLGAELTQENIYNYMEYFYKTRTHEFGNGSFAVHQAEAAIKAAGERGDEAYIIRADFGENEEYLEPVTMDTIMEELHQYPGLYEIGSEIIKNSISLYENRKAHGTKNFKSEGHILLIGGRGTGKAALAKLLCKAWGQAGILSGRPPVIVENPASCTNSEIKQKVDQAMKEHTVLMISHIHQCNITVIQDLLHFITEYPNLLCVLTMYPDKKEELFKAVPDLREKINNIEIPDYTPEQLTEIFKSVVKRQNREADESCINAIQIWLKNAYETRNGDHFYSNARMVENIVRKLEACTPEKIFTEADIPEEMRHEIEIYRHDVTFDKIIDEFENYVGWDELQKVLEDIKIKSDYQKRKPDYHMPVPNTLFIGNPGSGKTAAAELFAKACYTLGLVNTNRFYRYSAKDLIGTYVGETAQKTSEALEKGIDGVIFIDEAHHLAYNDNQAQASYNSDVVNVLLNFCTDPRAEKTLVILAGYEDKIRKFLSSDPGLSSRFPNTVHFKDFTASECYIILQKQLAKQGFVLDDFDTAAAENLLDSCISGGDFANGRAVGNICNEVITCHIQRMVKNIHAEDVITLEDIQDGIQAWKKKAL